MLRRLWSALVTQMGGRAPSYPRFQLSRLARAERASNIAAIRGLRATSYLGEQIALCVVLGRFKMFVDTRDLSLTPHLMVEGYWEMWVTEVVADIVKPGMTCVDAGANMGYFTLLFAELAGPEGKVVAFEPNQHLAELLRRSAFVNGFTRAVDVQCLLLEDRDDAYMRLNVTPEFAGGSSMEPPVHGDDLASLYTTRRMDSYPELLTADVIKIDVEGAELSVWRGMTGILQSGRPLTIFLEFVAARYLDAPAFLGEVESCGFSLAEITPSRGIVTVTIDDIIARPHDAELMLLLRR